MSVLYKNSFVFFKTLKVFSGFVCFDHEITFFPEYFLSLIVIYKSLRRCFLSVFINLKWSKVQGFPNIMSLGLSLFTECIDELYPDYIERYQLFNFRIGLLFEFLCVV